jgi:hypothetical protein
VKVQECRAVSRRLLTPLALAVAALLILAFAATAPAQQQQDAEVALSFGHDDSRDGTADEVVSGFFGGDDATLDPLANRVPNSYETFPFVVSEDARPGTFTVRIDWGSADIDLDLYVYRQRADGSLVRTALASSAQGGTTSEEATFLPSGGDPVPAGTYVVVVDNWCSNDADPLAAPEGGCDFSATTPPQPAIDEDDFTGRVTFGAAPSVNPLPVVTIAGPPSGLVGQALSFTATATDDGAVRNFAFDLDGDGRFELDNALNGVATQAFAAAGTYNIGVRVTDDRGGQSYASRAVSIAAPAPTVTTPPPPPAPVLQASLFRSLQLTRPVFGGRRNTSLQVRFAVREAGETRIELFRGSRLARRVLRSQRTAGRTFTATIRSRGLRAGLYTVRVRHRTAAGRTEVVRLNARLL